MQSRTGARTPTGTAVLPLLTLSVLGCDGVCLDVCFWTVGGVFVQCMTRYCLIIWIYIVQHSIV